MKVRFVQDVAFATWTAEAGQVVEATQDDAAEWIPCGFCEVVKAAPESAAMARPENASIAKAKGRKP